MKKVHGLLLLLALIFMATSCEDKYPDVKDGIYAEIITNKGTMFAELNYKGAPMTVANFVALAEGKHPLVADSLKGKKFYNGLIFHRVIEGFMIQGGDMTGTGGGDVGYKFPQEVSDSLKHDAPGVLSMANAGPNTNGSQFFIMHKPNPGLDGRYNVFGKVIKNVTVVDSIAVVAKEGEKPVEDVIMKEINIYRKGKEAKKWDAVKVFQNAVAASEKAEKELREKAEKLRAAAPAARTAKAAEIAALRAKATALPSGLMIYKVASGSGEKPAENAQVMVDYNGFFTDGKLFDSSNKDVAMKFDNFNPNREAAGAYGAMPVQYSKDMQMIPGFKEALLTLGYGDQIVAFIPSKLAYGEKGAGGVIPPNAELVFELKLEPKK